MMWSYLPAKSLIDLQRKTALEQMGREAKALFDEGYPVDGDRVLDAMNERQRQWEGT